MNFRPGSAGSVRHTAALPISALLPQLLRLLAFYRPGQLSESALVVGHLQVLDVVADVGGRPQRGGDVRVLGGKRVENERVSISDVRVY